MESPQNPEFRINPENFHPCIYDSPDLQGLKVLKTGKIKISEWLRLQGE